MQNLEALMVHILGSESLNVLFNEFEVSLIRLNGIAQIVLVDRFLVISQERTNCLDARSTLKILRSKKLIQVLFQRLSTSSSVYFKSR